jgi:hypothetical protein
MYTLRQDITLGWRKASGRSCNQFLLSWQWNPRQTCSESLYYPAMFIPGGRLQVSKTGGNITTVHSRTVYIIRSYLCCYPVQAQLLLYVRTGPGTQSRWGTQLTTHLRLAPRLGMRITILYSPIFS